MVLMVNSGSASAPRCGFWLSAEAEIGCGSVLLAILALRVDLRVNSAQVVRSTVGVCVTLAQPVRILALTPSIEWLWE
jgi:hypothetical protein